MNYKEARRRPTLLAKQAATLHHFSDGRRTLGVGVGWVEEEYRYLRADCRRRGRLADEYIEVIRELFDGDEPHLHGPSISYEDVLSSPKPATRLPIVVGGASDAALTRAATLGDGWHRIRLTPDQVRANVATLSAFSPRRGFEISLRSSARVNGAIDGPPGTSLSGSVDAVAETARALADAGVDHLVLEFDARGVADFVEQMTAFATYVTPQLAVAVAG